jgi:hypothetical protein
MILCVLKTPLPTEVDYNLLVLFVVLIPLHKVKMTTQLVPSIFFRCPLQRTEETKSNASPLVSLNAKWHL